MNVSPDALRQLCLSEQRTVSTEVDGHTVTMRFSRRRRGLEHHERVDCFIAPKGEEPRRISFAQLSALIKTAPKLRAAVMTNTWVRLRPKIRSKFKPTTASSR